MRITWSVSTVPESGSIRRPARTAVTWAEAMHIEPKTTKTQSVFFIFVPDGKPGGNPPSVECRPLKGAQILHITIPSASRAGLMNAAASRLELCVFRQVRFRLWRQHSISIGCDRRLFQPVL